MDLTAMPGSSIRKPKFIAGTEVPGRVFQVLLMISELEPMVQYGLLAQMKQV
ncbi:MAG: hypothetical protein HZC48_02005 [Nitrospirae bacterium]|nr:hypothetical protein [Nitrospirota bacterium]